MFEKSVGLQLCVPTDTHIIFTNEKNDSSTLANGHNSTRQAPLVVTVGTREISCDMKDQDAKAPVPSLTLL